MTAKAPTRREAAIRLLDLLGISPTDIDTETLDSLWGPTPTTR